MTGDELLDALESPRGQRAPRTAVTEVLRAGFAGHAPGPDANAGKPIRPSQSWLFATVERIRQQLGA